MVPPVREGRSRRRGLAILAGLALAAISPFVSDRLIPDGSETYRIIGILPDVTRIQPGTPVTVAGRRVGSVLIIQIREHGGGRHDFAVALQVARAAAPLIRRDSELRLAQPGLAGPPALEIEPGSADSPMLAPGDTLSAHAPVLTGTLARRAERLAAGVEALTASERELRERGGVSVARFQESVRQIETLRAELGATLAAYHDGPATLPADAERLRALAARFSETADSLQTRLGVLRDSAVGPLPRIRELHRALGAIADGIAHAEGFPGRLARDSALLKAVLAARADVDSLMAEIRRSPLDFVF